LIKSVAKNKKNAKNETKIEGAYLGNGLADLAQFWNWRCPTLREFAQKILCVSV